MTLYDGRPADLAGRLKKEIQTYDFLDALHIPYKRIDHEPAMTMEICKEIDESLDAVICKNLFLCNRQKTDFYLLMIPGDKRFKTKELSGQLGVARLSFGEPEDMDRLIQTTPGSASIMGLMFDTDLKVRLLVDRDVINNPNPFIGFHPCINTSSLRVSKQDVFDRLIPALKHQPTFVTLIGEE